MGVPANIFDSVALPWTSAHSRIVFNSGRFFCVATDYTTGQTVQVWSSADGSTPASWVNDDSLNNPSSRAAWGVYIDEVANLIYVLTDDLATGEVIIQVFDMATRTWGTPTTGGPTNMVGSNNLSIGKRSDGTFICAYWKAISTKDPVYAIYDPAGLGVWTTVDNPISALSSVGLAAFFSIQVCVDSVDKVHFYYDHTTDLVATAHKIWHVTLDAVNVLHTEQTIYTAPAALLSLSLTDPAIEWTAEGKIVVGFIYYEGVLSSTRRPGVGIANSGEDEPVWTVDFAPTTTNPGTQPSYCIFIMGGLLTCAWLKTNASVPTGLNDILYRQRDGAGVWSLDDIVFFDFSVDDPAPQPAVRFGNNICVALKADYTYGFVGVTTLTVSDGNPDLTSFFLGEFGESPTDCVAITATLIWSGPDSCIYDVVWDGDLCTCSVPLPHFLRSAPEEYMIGRTLCTGEDPGIYITNITATHFTICKANTNIGVSPVSCRVEVRRPHSISR